MDYFVSVYFNFCEYDIRTKLTKEFIERYPIVHLIEIAFGNKPFVINHSNTTQVRKKYPGFYTYQVINEFIRSHNNIKSLTILDSDLLVNSDFFESICYKLCDYIDIPVAIHGFSYATNVYKDNKITDIPIISMVKNYLENGIINGHTGYSWTFNDKFIELLGSDLFPECFIIGGFDYILALSLLSQYNKLSNLINNQKIKCIISTFYESIKSSEIDYINLPIKHYYHGDPLIRYKGRWDMYKDISPEVIKKYFESRKEC